MYHQIHMLDLYHTSMRLRFLIDEECTHPNAFLLDINTLIQRYLRLLLMNEFYPGHRFRDVLAPLIQRDNIGKPTQHAIVVATNIEEEIHDELLILTHVFLTLDESEKVVDVQVTPEGDAHIIVEERDLIQRQVDGVNDIEFGEFDAEEHALQKMFY